MSLRREPNLARLTWAHTACAGSPQLELVAVQDGAGAAAAHDSDNRSSASASAVAAVAARPAGPAGAAYPLVVVVSARAALAVPAAVSPDTARASRSA